MGIERQREKKVRRFAFTVTESPLEVMVVSNLGPAEPKRMKSTMICGIHAHLGAMLD